MSTHDEAASHPELTEAIVQVADCPCEEHHRGFLQELGQTGELIFSPMETPSDDGRVRLELVSGEGSTFLLCFPDLAAAQRYDPERSFVGIATESALDMVAGDPTVAGLFVATATPDDAWAVASQSDIRSLLAEGNVDGD